MIVGSYFSAPRGFAESPSAVQGPNDHPQRSEKRQVILLYDERTDLPGLSLLDAALVNTLTSESKEPIEIYREAMDLSRFGSDSYPLLLRDHLRAKYAGKEVDVVVAVMGPALDFLVSYGEDVFPGASFVFCGIDRRELRLRGAPSRITGILVKREFAQTVDVALRLHPDTRRFVVVSGTSEFDQELLQQAREEFRPYEGRVAFRYLTGLSLSELLTEVSQLPPHTVILYTTVFQDGAGEPFVPHEVVERVSRAANAPVYAFVDQYLGRGIVGGRLYNIDAHGVEAGRLVLQILAGATPSSRPLRELGTRRTMFDWRQLERWGISERSLPADAIVLFRPESLWRQYRPYALGATALVGLQMLIIVSLLLQRHRRRRAEAELRESEFRLRTMADSAPVMIWISGPDGRFEFLNRRWLGFSGSTLAEQRGEAWTGRVHPDDLEQCLEVQREGLEQRKGFSVECRMRRHDWIYRWMLCSAIPRLSLDDTFMGHIGSCTDITERKEGEIEMQRHRAELARASRIAMMGEFTASVAHELKQPLAAILSNAEAAEMYLAADPPAVEEVRAILADIRKSDKSAADIINRIRGFLEKHELVREPVQVNRMVEGALKLVGIEGSVRRVTINFEPTPGLPRVMGDGVHLQQVLMNLILNGLDAMSSVPEELRRLVIRTARGENGAVRLAVSDSGSGIAENAMQRLFDPFFSTKEHGLGMGLAITRAIVEAHEGRVWVDSELGVGTTFYVELPLYVGERG